MLLMVDTKQARWVYRVLRNFCGSLFLRIGDFSVLRKLIFGIRTHWLFSMRINFCDFQKIPSTFPASRGISRRGKNERRNERPLLAGNQYPALKIFSFLISMCNQGAIEIRYIFSNGTTGNSRYLACKTSISLYRLVCEWKRQVVIEQTRFLSSVFLCRVF